MFSFATALLICCQGLSGHWVSEIALQAPDKLGGCAIGDVDPSRDGQELVAVSITGEVYLVHREGVGWKSKVIFKASGELIQCAIGDADPDRPGMEIVAVGMAAGDEDQGGPGAAYVISRVDGKWRGEKAFQDGALLHGVCVTPEGAVLVGYTRTAWLLTRSGGSWKTEKMGELPGPGKAAVARQHDVVVACADGSLVRLGKTATGGWQSVVMDRRPVGRARLGTDGERILSSDDDGTLMLIENGRRQAIYSEGAKLRGAVLADLDPSAPGLEAATVGYEKKVTVLYRKKDEWRPWTLFRETEKFHHLAAGDLDGRPGAELAACGYAGRVIVLRCFPR